MRYRDPAATWLGSPNFSLGRPNGIQWIVLHTMVGSWQAANARFQNPTAQASAHHGVNLDGSREQWVDEGDTAWHAGDFTVNEHSIGIEHEDGGNYNSPRPDALYAASSTLVAAICSRYGLPVQRGDYAAGILGCIDHRTVYATGCPDALDTDRIIQQAQRFGPGGGTIGGQQSEMYFPRDPSNGTIYAVYAQNGRTVKQALTQDWLVYGQSGATYHDIVDPAALAALLALPNATVGTGGGTEPPEPAEPKNITLTLSGTGTLS